MSAARPAGAQVAALRREAAKWQELEEGKAFLETQVAQMRAREQAEAARASDMAAQARSLPWAPLAMLAFILCIQSTVLSDTSIE